MTSVIPEPDRLLFEDEGDQSKEAVYERSRCSVCSAFQAFEIADRAAIRLEMERVWTFHTRRLRHPVPPKYLTDRVVFSQPPPLRLVQCAECTHLYRSPRESADTVRRTYSQDSLNETVYQSLFQNQRLAYQAQVRRLLGFASNLKRGLEVGSYMGGFLAAARDAAIPFTGIDVNRSAVEFGARQGLQISTCTLEEVQPSEKLDVIAIWNTFEQLPDVRVAARVARRLLRQGGVLAVRVPNGAYYVRWRGRLKSILAPWAERALVHNNLLGFPYREGFTPRSIRRLFDDGGFRIGRVHGDTLVPLADQWTTTAGAIDEWVTKKIQRVAQHGWRSPWLEVYATAR
jgi:2-polyprenyl-3-methyl-5-hydroxy-6-metoxy-1,4-benzoquinol methylase